MPIENCLIKGVQSADLGPASDQNPRLDGLIFVLRSARATESTSFLERAMGIEPTSEAWEASILPLYDARSFL